MFPILLASMVEDCQANIRLNWLTGKLFFNENYTLGFLSNYLNACGIILF